MITKLKNQGLMTAIRKRTPTEMIRPMVQAVLADMLNSDRQFSRREIAVLAGISQQTLYHHTLDLVEAAEKEWVQSHESLSQAAARIRQENDALKRKDKEIQDLTRRLDEVTLRMRWMLTAVQQYAPNALPKVTEVLIPDFLPLTEK